MTKNKVIRAVIIFAVAFVIAAVLIPSSRYTNFIEQKVLSLINQGPIKASSEGLELHWIGASLSKLKLFLPRYFVGLDLEQVRAEVALISLLKFSPRIDLQGNALGGNLDLSFPISISSSGGSFNFHLNALKLSSHPQLEALGLKNGVLSLSSDQFVLSQAGEPQGTIKFGLANFSIPNGFTIPKRFTQMQNDLMVPKIEDLNLSTSIECAPLSIAFNTLDLSSSMGKAKGALEFSMGAKKQLQVSLLNLDLTLTEDGATLFQIAKQFLESSGSAAFSGNPTSKHWTIKLVSSSPLKVDFKAL